MKQHELATLAAEALAAEPIRTASPEPSADVLRDMEDVIAQLPNAHRSSVARWSAVAVAAGLALTIGTGYWFTAHKAERIAMQPVAGHVEVLRPGHDPDALHKRTMLAEGDRVVAAESGSAAITFVGGTHLGVGSEGDLTILQDGTARRFLLRRGSVRADVAKLHPGERFVMETADAQVEVRGTSFEVSVTKDDSCGKRGRTRVVVFEGVVSVRTTDGEDRVSAGQSWPFDCGSPRTIREIEGAAARVAAAAGDRAEPEPPAPIAVSKKLPTARPINAKRASETDRAPAAPEHGATEESSAAAPTPASSLADENALFASAIQAKQGGDARRAADQFGEFAKRYPRSNLSENALAERFRLLAKVDPVASRAAAAEYLRSFPKGFAASEARVLVAGTH